MAVYPNDRFHQSVFLLLVGLLALSGVSPVPLRAWRYDFQGFSRQPIPYLPLALAPLTTGDLNGDGIQEEISTRDSRAEIRTAGVVAWRSPEGWLVKQAILADLNLDGRLEAVLLVWRDFRPWPVDQFMPNGGRIAGFHNPQGESCHLVLIGWKKTGYGELWAGSALAEPLLKIAAIDLNEDGEQELAVLESDYQDPPGYPARAFSAWEWNGFGFSLLARAKGKFRQLQVIVPTAQPPYVLVQE
jgi:hypothetical protein